MVPLWEFPGRSDRGGSNGTAENQDAAVPEATSEEVAKVHPTIEEVVHATPSYESCGAIHETTFETEGVAVQTRESILKSIAA